MSSVTAAFSWDLVTLAQRQMSFTQNISVVKMHREKYHPIINHSKCKIRV